MAGRGGGHLWDRAGGVLAVGEGDEGADGRVFVAFGGVTSVWWCERVHRCAGGLVFRDCGGLAR